MEEMDDEGQHDCQQGGDARWRTTCLSTGQRCRMEDNMTVNREEMQDENNMTVSREEMQNGGQHDCQQGGDPGWRTT